MYQIVSGKAVSPAFPEQLKVIKMRSIFVLVFIYFCFKINSQNCVSLYSYGASFDKVNFFNQSNLNNAHYYWNFGDGTGSYLKDPIHYFPENGNYLVTLYVNDTISNCSSHYDQWLSITKYSTDPCSPSISDSIIYDPTAYFKYKIKILDYSSNCGGYSTTYKIGSFSSTASNVIAIPLYPSNCISAGYYYQNNSLKRAAIKTSPNNYNRSKNYNSCSANFEFSVVSETNNSQRILFKAMNKNAAQYDWMILGFGDPIRSSYDTISVVFPEVPATQFPNLGNDVILTIKEQNGCRDSLWQQVIIKSKSSTYVGIRTSEIEDLKINLFPNPVKDKFILEFQLNNITLDYFIITNSLGQIVLTSIRPNSNQETDLSFLSSGIYFLQAKNKEGQKVFKIVKE